jgi:hypothetical protein
MHLGTPLSVGRIDQRAASFRLDAPVCGDVNQTLAAGDTRVSGRRRDRTRYPGAGERVAE